MKLVVLAAILILTIPAHSAPACQVNVQPKVALAPVRFLRIKTTIEHDARNRDARLELNGPNGFETGSDLQTDVRTRWIEWKNILLVTPGTYEVWLGVNGSGCQAREQVIVAGDGAARPGR